MIYNFINSKLLKKINKLIPYKYNLKFRNNIFKFLYFLLPSNSLEFEDIKLKRLIDKNYTGIEYSDIQIFDIGAGHPKIHSNTYKFHKKGSTIVAVDANQDLLNIYKKVRPSDTCIFAGISTGKAEELKYYKLEPWELSTTNKEWYRNAVDKLNANLIEILDVPSKTLEDIINENYDKNKKIHILSIDIEGTSGEVIKSCDFNNYKFDILVVEKDTLQSNDLENNYDVQLEDKFNKYFVRI